MKCDFCEFEDNVSKSNKYKHPDGWLAVQVHEKYNRLHACPKCARLLMVCLYMVNRTGARVSLSYSPDPEELEQFFPNLKRKENTDEVQPNDKNM